jgi:splicing factor 3A subunit 3
MLLVIELDTLFSGEEGNGRFLDLNPLYTQYINLKHIKRVDYLAYLSNFDDFKESYPKETKTTADYKNYLAALQSYLESFFARAKPLYNVDALREKTKEKFESDWKEKNVPGWEKKLGEEEEAAPELFCIACKYHWFGLCHSPQSTKFTGINLLYFTFTISRPKAV